MRITQKYSEAPGEKILAEGRKSLRLLQTQLSNIRIFSYTQIIQKEKKTAILITHDISEAISMADRVYVLSARPATIKAEIPIHLTVEGLRTPLRARSAPEFSTYFNMIYKELNTNEAIEA